MTEECLMNENIKAALEFSVSVTSAFSAGL